MNICEACGQRVEIPKEKNATNYIPWCENRIKELEKENKELKEENQYNDEWGWLDK